MHHTLDLTKMDGGNMTFGNNEKCKICGGGTICNSFLSINDVLYVEGFKNNLLRISQLCDKGHKFVFEPNFCCVHDVEDNNGLFIAYRKDNIYIVDFNDFAKEDTK